MSLRPRLTLAFLLCTTPVFAQQAPAPGSSASARLPTLFVVGDTASAPVAPLFDPNRLNVVERAADGATTRAYIQSGRWDDVLAKVKPGDFVLLEFGPGQSAQDKADAARTLDGFGDGTFDYLDPGTHKVELVHSYGWYLRRMVVDVINHGGSPILCSPPSTPGAAKGYPDWTRYIAGEERVPFLDLSTGAEPRVALGNLKPDPLQPYLKS